MLIIAALLALRCHLERSERSPESRSRHSEGSSYNGKDMFFSLYLLHQPLFPHNNKSGGHLNTVLAMGPTSIVRRFCLFRKKTV